MGWGATFLPYSKNSDLQSFPSEIEKIELRHFTKYICISSPICVRLRGPGVP